MRATQDHAQRQQAIFDRVQARIDLNAHMAALEAQERRQFMEYLETQLTAAPVDPALPR